jgi:hypothetical protein
MDMTHCPPQIWRGWKTWSYYLFWQNILGATAVNWDDVRDSARKQKKNPCCREGGTDLFVQLLPPFLSVIFPANVTK